jgi:hypothetical protein
MVVPMAAAMGVRVSAGLDRNGRRGELESRLQRPRIWFESVRAIPTCISGPDFFGLNRHAVP